MADIMRI